MIGGICVRGGGGACPPWDTDGFGAKATGPRGIRVLADLWLDNRPELVAALGGDAARLSDAGLIATGYARWGDAVCDRLLGDFAIAIHDPDRGRLLLARDPIGARPLYYAVEDDRVLFDGELDRLLGAPGLVPRLDEPMLAAHLLRPFTMLPAMAARSFWQGIHKVQPGHQVIVSAAGVAVRRWHRWEDAPDIRFKRDDDYVEALAERLAVAVGRCLVTSRPVASHLSGGIDCSSIAALAARQLGEQGRQLAAGYTWLAGPGVAGPDGGVTSDQGEDGYYLGAAVARAIGVTLHSLPTTAEAQAALALTDFTRHPTVMLDYEQGVLRHAARSGIGVILSGWGGDEVVTARHAAGWFDLLRQGRYVAAWRLHRKGEGPTPRLLRDVAAWGRYGLLGDVLPAAPPPVGGAAQCFPLPFIDPGFARRALADPDLTPAMPLRLERGLAPACRSRLEIGHLECRIDSWARAGARHGVVYRYPLLDRELVQFALGLPVEATCLHGRPRGLFRSAMSGVLPDIVRKAAKDRDVRRVQRLAAANEAANRLIATRADIVTRLPPFDWVDGGRLRAALKMPVETAVDDVVRRQAARLLILAQGWTGTAATAGW